jgi:hypothetical protein
MIGCGNTRVNRRQPAVIRGSDLFLPHTLKWNIYNFTRLEFRQVYHHDTLTSGRTPNACVRVSASR